MGYIWISNLVELSKTLIIIGWIITWHLATDKQYIETYTVINSKRYHNTQHCQMSLVHLTKINKSSNIRKVKHCATAFT